MGEHETITFNYKNTKKLIQLVQGHPCLWDRQASDYKDRLARDRSWGQIFEEMDPSYKNASSTTKHDISMTITKKWNNIRDAYVKSLKPDYLGRRARPYIHAELMKFLDDCYLEKINTSFLEKMNRQHNEMEELEAEVVVDAESEPWEQKVFVNLDVEQPVQKRQRLDSTDLVENPKNDEDIISVLSNLIQREEDEDRAFFKSITPSVKRLSEESKYEFRIEVLKLIKNLRAKEKGTKGESNESDSE